MIHQKLIEIQKSVRALQRDAKAYNYNYVSGDKLLYFVRPKMDELGLLLLPEVLGVETRDVTYQQWDKGAKAMVEKKEILYVLTMRMTWTDTKDGETLPQEWRAAGMNAFDKGYGSALTYGERYYLLKLFHIATDEDDVDAVSSVRDAAMDAAGPAPETKPKAKKAKAPAPVDGPSPEPALEEALAEVGAVKSYEELLAAWAKWKPLFGKEPALIQAIAACPYNEKRKEERDGAGKE